MVTIHELTHSRVAQHFGVEVKGITLLPIGGMAQMAEIPKEPRKELLISVAGPASNLVIGFVMVIGAFFIYAPGELSSLEAFGGLLLERSFKGAYLYLTVVNLTLAVFNLLPAFPLDGGRCSAPTGSQIRAGPCHPVAVRVGQALALGLGCGPAGRRNLVLLVAVFIFFGAQAEGQGEEPAGSWPPDSRQASTPT